MNKERVVAMISGKGHILVARSMRSLTAVLTGVLLLVGACSQQPRHPAPPVSGDVISFDVASLRLDSPQFFTYVHQGKNISFFVIKLNSGVSSFFDACVTCFRKKLGYAAQNGQVVCRACDTAYSIYKLDTGFGGCYPIPIRGRTDGGVYRIPLSTIIAGAGKF